MRTLQLSNVPSPPALHAAITDGTNQGLAAPSGPYQGTPAVSYESTPDDNLESPSAPKKRATDQETANRNVCSDATDMEVNQGDFTLLTYKKKRAAGIPVVFEPTEGYSLWKVNPNVLASEVVATAQEKVLTHRLTKDGRLIVTLSSLAAANRLLHVSILAGVPVEVRVPRSYMATYGKILGVPLEYTDEALGNYLRDQGVLCPSASHLHTK